MAQSSQLDASMRSTAFSAICLSLPISRISSIEYSEPRSKTSTSTKSSGMKCLSRSSKKSSPTTAISPGRVLYSGLDAGSKAAMTLSLVGRDSNESYILLAERVPRCFRTSAVCFRISRMFMTSPWTFLNSIPVSSLMAETSLMSFIRGSPRISTADMAAIWRGVTAKCPTTGRSTLAFRAVARAASLVITSEHPDTSEYISSTVFARNMKGQRRPDIQS